MASTPTWPACFHPTFPPKERYKPREPFYSVDRKSIVASATYPIEVMMKEKTPISGLFVKESQMRSNFKNQVNSELGLANGEVIKLSAKSSGLTDNSRPTLSPTSPLDSRNRVKHRSVSFANDIPHSVIRKQEKGPIVRNLCKIHSSKPSSPEYNKTCLYEKSKSKSKDSNFGASTLGQSKTSSIFLFGNIYRRRKNLVLETNSSHRNAKQANYAVSKCAGVGGLDAKPILSNNHVLGFGKRNYGHGSIIKGGVNVEILKNSNYSNVGSREAEEKWTCPNTSIAPYLKGVEEFKNAGNEAYRSGFFLKAISFYDKVISICPRNAACHNNKAAALAALGRCKEAVTECREAINCDPLYSHACYRLGNLFIRLGQLEDAKEHFKSSGEELGLKDGQNLLYLESCLLNIKKAQKTKDWNGIAAEATLAFEAGVDASDEVIAAKAEVLFKLHRPAEALELLISTRKREGGKWTKAQGGDSYLLIIETQVCMCLGRFDEAVTAAENAVNLDPRPESLMWLRKAMGVADARRAGNESFKSGNYIEACIAYTKGLELSPTHSVLLCNRAACKTKLGQWEMAIDDCTAALRNRPDYTKALIRRAHCNALLERWEESIKDYTLLREEIPGDISIANAFLQVQIKFSEAQQKGAYGHQAGGCNAHHAL